METKLIKVFFDANCLPYKDSERSVHFPIVGGAFLGASNTTKIRFYFDRIGDTSATYVSVAKLPNGKQGSQILSKSSDENGNYAELELSNWYTQAKGDVYIALQGYSGGTTAEFDETTGLWTIEGSPIIQTTGSIKLAINYAPIGDSPDYNDEFTTYQEILADLGDKVDKKETSGPHAYTHDGSVQGEIKVEKNDIGGAIVQRTENAQIIVPYTPSTDSNATSKKYVDDSIASAITSVYKYKGSVATYSDLPSSGLTIGDVYNVEETGDNYAWTGTTWDKLAGDIDLSDYATKNYVDTGLSGKQNTLVNQVNIKSINNQSLLGTGNIDIQGGGGGGIWGTIIGNIQDQTDLMEKFEQVAGDIADETSRAEGVEGQLEEKIEDIEDLIPAQATPQNQLADKDFVNSSIATNTATFRGTYNVVSDLSLTTSATHEQIAAAIATKLASLSIVSDNNDYVFVSFPNASVSTDFDKYERYKFNGTSWEYEFTLNNSSFTAQQWAAINSGITASMVADLPLKSANNTWGGQNTFENGVFVSNITNSTANDMVILTTNPTSYHREIDAGVNLVCKYYNGSYLVKVNWADYGSQFQFNELIMPMENNTYDVGTSQYNWRDGYFSGQVYAQNTYNVINASDIANNTLTQAQYDLITNGKPTLIKGTYLGHKNMLITYWTEYSTTWRALAIAEGYVFSMMLNTSTKALTEGGDDIRLSKIASINGKQLPAYPTNPTVPQAIIYDTDNSLKYIDTQRQWYGTQAQYDALGTYDSNTTYNIIED